MGEYPMVEQPEGHSNLALWVPERVLLDPETH